MFDELAESAAVVDCPIRCATNTVDVVTCDDVRVIAARGGARSQKTHTGVGWLFRRWGLVGGAGVNFWMMGPELDRAFVLVEKWAIGEDGGPPICPPELMLRWPVEAFSLRTHPTIDMLDGTTITARHCGRQGKNLAARNVRAILWTEAATTSSPMDFVRARGRIVQSRGAIYVDFVPEARNWVRPAIVEAASAEAEEIESAAARGEPARRRTYLIRSLDIESNPWVDQEEAKAFRRDLDRIDPRIGAREAGGEDVDDYEPLFDFDAALHTFEGVDEYEEPESALDRLGFVDCTVQASLRWFVTGKPWIIALDINRDPHTALIGKIAVQKKRDPTDPRQWHPFFFDTLQVSELDSEQAAERLVELRGGMYSQACVVIDATASGRHNAGGALNQRKHIKPRQAYERVGYEVRGARRVPGSSSFQNPDAIDGSIVCRRLMRERKTHIERRRCGPFIYALKNQTTEPDGITPLKKRNTNQDRFIAAFTDVFRYWVWPFFNLKPHEERGDSLAVKEYG